MKDKIVIKNTSIVINDYDLGENPRFEANFQVYKKASREIEYKYIEYKPDTHQLIIPRGVDIDYIENTFRSRAVLAHYNEVDDFEYMTPLSLKMAPRSHDYDEGRQKETMKFLLGVDEYTPLKNATQLCVTNATGSGKTYVTVASLAITGDRYAIIAGKTNLLLQWKKCIIEYTNINPNEICVVIGEQIITKLLYHGYASKYRVFLISHQTINAYASGGRDDDNNVYSAHGWESIHKLFNALKITTKVFDEAHEFADNIGRIDFNTNTKRTLYLTATLGRSDKDDNRVYQLYFKNVPKFSYRIESDKHVHYIAIHFNSKPKGRSFKNYMGFDKATYIKWLVRQEIFEKLLMILIDIAWRNIDGKVLLYVGINESGEYVRDLIIKNLPFLSDHIGIYTSVTNPMIKQEQLKKKFIITTTKSAGTGNDIPDLKGIINLAEPYYSKILAQQTLGRCREYGSFYFDLVDNGLSILRRYNDSKLPIYYEYALSVDAYVYSEADIDEKYNDAMNRHENLIIPGYNLFN